VLHVDPRLEEVTDVIDVGSEADDVAVGDAAVWVIDKLDSTVSRIDPENDRVIATLPLSGNLERVVAEKGRSGCWIRWRAPLPRSTLTTTGSVRRSRSVRSPTIPRLAWERYGADQSDDSMYRIDPVTHNVERIQVGAPLASVVVDEADHSLWVAVAAPATAG
jgi:hypothetical protein